MCIYIYMFIDQGASTKIGKNTDMDISLFLVGVYQIVYLLFLHIVVNIHVISMYYIDLRCCTK
jgi:hypothetical protein